ncbi:MAG: zinc finger MYND domain-containing protein [Legionellales bacterium]|nr:zinc finger MYND domain-containing protein [Legionellales bacterium]
MISGEQETSHLVGEKINTDNIEIFKKRFEGANKKMIEYHYFSDVFEISNKYSNGEYANKTPKRNVFVFENIILDNCEIKINGDVVYLGNVEERNNTNVQAIGGSKYNEFNKAEFKRFLIEHLHYKQCVNCGDILSKYKCKQCDSCEHARKTRYCSRKCQKIDWKGCHSSICFPSGSNVDIKMITLINQSSGVGEYIVYNEDFINPKIIGGGLIRIQSGSSKKIGFNSSWEIDGWKVEVNFPNNTHGIFNIPALQIGEEFLIELPESIYKIRGMRLNTGNYVITFREK